MKALENIRVADLTVGQLSQLMRDIVHETMAEAAVQPERETFEDYTSGQYVYGIGGIARLLGVSKTYAQRLKSSGTLDDAICQRGRKIICDSNKAVMLFGDLRNKKK